MIEQGLILLGAGIYGFLATAHLIYTFFSNKFDARDPRVNEAMKATSPVLTRRLTMWNAWIGFNGSHSLGGMLLSAIYLLLGFRHMDLLRSSPSFLILAIVFSLGYLALGLRYWFRTPTTGIAVATACFIAAAVKIWV
ncbi:MAG TPA: hypothetical protein VN851_21660 [Thermoanaerobaculia bacterium]|nr:hypothetical protein [Thermoanaerobaculia bacterium]